MWFFGGRKFWQIWWIVSNLSLTNFTHLFSCTKSGKELAKEQPQDNLRKILPLLNPIGPLSVTLSFSSIVTNREMQRCVERFPVVSIAAALDHLMSSSCPCKVGNSIKSNCHRICLLSQLRCSLKPVNHAS